MERKGEAAASTRSKIKLLFGGSNFRAEKEEAQVVRFRYNNFRNLQFIDFDGNILSRPAAGRPEFVYLPK